MIPHYYVLDRVGREIPAVIRSATLRDYRKTKTEHWQTDWESPFIQQEALEKYALSVQETGELIGLGAYRNVEKGLLVYVAYIESSPENNPTYTAQRKYRGVGAALLAYGIQLSIDYGYGGAIYLKAKTSELRKHYIQNFGAIPFSRSDPYLLLIEGDAARNLFLPFLKEES